MEKLELTIEQANQILFATDFFLHQENEDRWISLHDSDGNIIHEYRELDMNLVLNDILKLVKKIHFEYGQDSARNEIKKALGMV